MARKLAHHVAKTLDRLVPFQSLQPGLQPPRMTDEGREPWASYIDLLIEEIDKIAGPWWDGRFAMKNGEKNAHFNRTTQSTSVVCLKIRHLILSDG